MEHSLADQLSLRLSRQAGERWRGKTGNVSLTCKDVCLAWSWTTGQYWGPNQTTPKITLPRPLRTRQVRRQENRRRVRHSVKQSSDQKPFLFGTLLSVSLKVSCTLIQSILSIEKIWRLSVFSRISIFWRTIFWKNNKPHVWLIRKSVWEFQVGNSLLWIRINQDMPLATKVKGGWIETQIAYR